jgi:hypothetical protein
MRCCRGLERFVEKDLRDMEWSKVLTVFIMLFLRAGVTALQSCADEHGSDKRVKSTIERRRAEEAFQNVFVRLVEKHLAQLGYTSPLGTADLVHNRREFYSSVEFLLDLDSAAAERSGLEVSAESDGDRRHLVGSSTVGNPRLVGGEGHKPMVRGLGERTEKRGALSKKAGTQELIYESDADPARQVRYMQGEMARLKKENRQLRLQKQDIESIYQQLISEQRHEKFDQRRLNLLKSQNLQLERQLAMTSSALRCRQDVAHQMNDLLADLDKRLGSIGEDNEETHERLTTLDETQTAALLDLLAKHKVRLTKSCSLAKTSCTQQQLYYSIGRSPSTATGLRRRSSNFVRGGRNNQSKDAPPLFVQDVITVAVTDPEDQGRLGTQPAPVRHLDLSAVAALERSLVRRDLPHAHLELSADSFVDALQAALAPLLLQLRQGLSTVLPLPHMLSPATARLEAVARECCQEVHSAAFDLSTLATLLPSCPPPPSGGGPDHPLLSAYLPPAPKPLTVLLTAGSDSPRERLGSLNTAAAVTKAAPMVPLPSAEQVRSLRPLPNPLLACTAATICADSDFAHGVSPTNLIVVLCSFLPNCPSGLTRKTEPMASEYLIRS